MDWICEIRITFVFPTSVKFNFITIVYVKHILLQLKLK